LIEIENWLNSGTRHSINGIKLIPQENPVLKKNPIIISRGQADVVVVEDSSRNKWMLKKFKHGKSPDFTYIDTIQRLIPRIRGFEAGYNRQVIEQKKLSAIPADLTKWLHQTILMPRVKGVTWAELADDIRDGTLSLTHKERLTLVSKISQLILELENNNISHRDLSSTNIMIDKSAFDVGLIDWDCMYHPHVSMPTNTTFGTEGYISPFVYTAGMPRTTWQDSADRFSLAVVIIEFLGLTKGSLLAHDGGMCEQSCLCSGSISSFGTVLKKVKSDFPPALKMLEQALTAKTFADCPAPSEWINFAGGTPSVSPKPPVITIPPPPIIPPIPPQIPPIPPRPIIPPIYQHVKYCSKCGTMRAVDYKYCPECGLHVGQML